MARYKYTCPDVINYRKNQYRLAIWSNVINVGFMAIFWGGLMAISKRTERDLDKKFDDLHESES